MFTAYQKRYSKSTICPDKKLYVCALAFLVNQKIKLPQAFASHSPHALVPLISYHPLTPKSPPPLRWLFQQKLRPRTSVCVLVRDTYANRASSVQSAPCQNIFILDLVFSSDLSLLSIYTHIHTISKTSDTPYSTQYSN